MAKKAGMSLSERIAERAKRKQKQARGGANRAEFLAVKEDVAKALGVSHSTAKYHVLKLYRTLGVTSAAEALRKARRP